MNGVQFVEVSLSYWQNMTMMLYGEKMDDRIEGGEGAEVIWAKLFHLSPWLGKIRFWECGDRVSSDWVQCPVSSEWWGQGDTITDTIAILQIHSKIQYLQLSPAPAPGIFLSSPPTKSAKWYFVILWRSYCDWSRDSCTPPNVRSTFYIAFRRQNMSQLISSKLFYLHINHIWCNIMFVRATSLSEGVNEDFHGVLFKKRKKLLSTLM